MKKNTILIAFFLAVMTSCARKGDISFNYETPKARLLSDYNIKSYFEALEKSRSTVLEFTLKNQEQASGIIEARTKGNLSIEQKSQFKNKLYNISKDNQPTHGKYRALAQFHYLKAYEKYVISKKISKESFKTILKEEISRKYLAFQEKLGVNQKAAY